MKVRITAVLAALTVLFTASCAGADTKETDSMENASGYNRISQEEALEMMEEQGEEITIVDVRTEAEFLEGHIPGAICVPNESIDSEPPAELPDKDAVLLVYCRSGRRSKEASEKLAAMGYTNVYEFGGIIDWEGETEMGEEMTENASKEEEFIDIRIFTRTAELPVTWVDCPTVRELYDLLADGPITIRMRMYSDNEQYGMFGSSLHADDVRQEAVPGDIMLYKSDQIVIFYGYNTWEYTKLGHIQLSEKQMVDLLSHGGIEITLDIED